ncbi:MAG: peptidoglycan D,D-transpeptidase FtsI family protein [Candidatus Limnocylindria bacterium]
MLARTDSRFRALVLLAAFSIVATVIAGRLAWWHVFQRERLTAMALEQMAQSQTIPSERGEITDRNGVLLATSVELKSVFATPPTVADPHAAAELLAPLTGIAVGDLEERLASDAPWVWIDRRVPQEVSEAVRDLALPGIGMVAETQRVYPVTGAVEGTTMGAQLLGYVNVDGVGQYGVEEALDPQLAGSPGWVTADEDVAGRQIADTVYEVRSTVDGSDVQLTVDAGLQHILEAQMSETYRANQAHGATGIVMDVHTGAVLAMANFPAFDANAYSRTDPELFVNPAVTRQYEPGSVMKPFTIAAALDSGTITTRDTFVDDNNLQIADVRIQNADRYTFPWGHGDVTARDVLLLSNNVGAARIGLALGGQGLYDALRNYGFGQPTGVEIAGEASGVVWNPDGPNGSGDLTTAQNSFGQGISVTAVQLVAGYAAIANGGTLMQPHIVASWNDPDGTVHEVAPTPVRRVMSQETAGAVLQLLTDSVDEGIANGAAIAGYSIAGKTGTAQIAGPVTVRADDGADADGDGRADTTTVYRYIDGWIDSSIVNILPANDPQLVTLILIHRPAIWGLYQMQQTPEQVFSALAPRILDYLAIPPDRPIQGVATP